MLQKLLQSQFIEKNILKIEVLEVRKMGDKDFGYMYVAKDNFNTYVSNNYTKKDFINKYKSSDSLKQHILRLREFRGLVFIDNNHQTNRYNEYQNLNINADIEIKGFDF